MEESKLSVTKVSINLPTELVERVKEYSKTMGVNVTSGYVFLLNKALEQDKMFDAITAMTALMSEYDKKNN